MSAIETPPWAVILPRTIVAVIGPDAAKFLQGLISNDATRASAERSVYAFLLTPQGKYLFDFFLHAVDGGIDLDVAAEDASALTAKLIQYKLRSKVSIIEREGFTVAALFGGTISGSLPDPRFSGMGQRVALPGDEAEAVLRGAGFEIRGSGAYNAHRIALGVPDHADFESERSFLLECNGEELHGVDFRKGCYVGQELTARMKHRGTARRRILRVAGTGLARGAAVMDGAREIGEVLSVQDGHGLAMIRLERWREAQGRPLTANGLGVEVTLPAYPMLLPPEEAVS
jgi:hypothetical protein